MSTEAREPINAKQFHALFPTLGPLNQAGYLPPLLAALREFSIDTPKRVAAFLAQLGHESLDLTRWRESFAYSPERLLEVFPASIKSLEHAREVKAGGPKAIAEAVYGRDTTAGARLGNTQPGDGWLFPGRGPHQLTGRDNYQRHADVLGVDLVVNPDQLEQPNVGFRSAGLFWLSKGLGPFADLDTIDGYRAITKRWNGGYHGWDDRLRRWREARAVMGLPAIVEPAKEA